MSEADNLTGVWNGTFTLPFGLPPITFTATLLQSGDHISGSIQEPCSVSGCPIATHDAGLSGARAGRAVTFEKSYDPPGYGYASVAYDGVLNADATEISGSWSIAANLNGQFLMVRAARKAKSRARKKLAEIER